MLSNPTDKRSEPQQKRTWAWGSTTFIHVHEAQSWQVMWTSQSIWDYAGQEEKSSLFSSLDTAFRCPTPSIIINKMGRSTSSFVWTCKKESDTRSSCFLTASYYKHTNNLILPQRNVFNSDNCISCHLICLPWKKLICWWLSKSLHGLKCSEKVVESKLEGLVRTRAEERQPLHKLLHHSPGGRIDD